MWTLPLGPSVELPKGPRHVWGVFQSGRGAACEVCHWDLRWSSLWGHETCEGCAKADGDDCDDYGGDDDDDCDDDDDDCDDDDDDDHGGDVDLYGSANDLDCNRCLRNRIQSPGRTRLDANCNLKLTDTAVDKNVDAAPRR